MDVEVCQENQHGNQKNIFEPFIKNKKGIKHIWNLVDLTNFYWMVCFLCTRKGVSMDFCLGFDHKKHFYNPLFVNFFAEPYVILILVFHLFSIASNALRKKTCFLWPIQLYGGFWIEIDVVNDSVLFLSFKTVFETISNCRITIFWTYYIYIISIRLY